MGGSRFPRSDGNELRASRDPISTAWEISSSPNPSDGWECRVSERTPDGCCTKKVENRCWSKLRSNLLAELAARTRNEADRVGQPRGAEKRLRGGAPLRALSVDLGAGAAAPGSRRLGEPVPFRLSGPSSRRRLATRLDKYAVYDSQRGAAAQLQATRSEVPFRISGPGPSPGPPVRVLVPVAARGLG